MAGVSMSPVTVTAEGAFPFSPRPNRAPEIAWREWGERPFDEARRRDRPILLSLAAFWSTESNGMDEGAYSDQRVINLAVAEWMIRRGSPRRGASPALAA